MSDPRCKGKREFKTSIGAHVSAASVLRHNPSDTDSFRAYRCRYCKCWHLTKSQDEAMRGKP
jgi:hypothetical protein